MLKKGLIREFSPFQNACIIIIFLCLFTICAPLVYANPYSFLTEKVNAEFDCAGTLISQDNRGYVEVDVANNQDVLQFISIDFSDMTNTNLNSLNAYAAVAASPSNGDRTRIYLNTNESGEAIYYTFSNAPIINITPTYQNEKGGTDLAPGENKITINIFLSASEPFTGVVFDLKAGRNTFGINDSLNFVSADSSTGIVSLIDTDMDGFTDNLRWAGDLNKIATITLTATITPDINYLADLQTVNIDSEESRLNYLQSGQISGTFTGNYIPNKFARGPVRQGVIIKKKANWIVSGFMKNIASGTYYRVHKWSLYKVLDDGSLENSSSASGVVGDIFSPGGLTGGSGISCNSPHTVCTDMYDTGITADNTTKKLPAIYYAASFDWEVDWEQEMCYGIIDEKLNLPVFYQIDLGLDKRIDLIKNDESGRILSIRDEIKHLGHSNLRIANLSANLTGLNGWTHSDLKIYCTNSTNTTELTNYSSCRMGDLLNINLSLDDSAKLRLNDIILIDYKLSKGSEDENKVYYFGLNTVAVTESGTPVAKNLSEDITVPGIKKDDGGGSGGGGGSGETPEKKEILEILKIDSSTEFITNSMVENEISFRVIDTGSKGARDVALFLYLPEKSSLEESSVSVYLLINGTEKRLEIELEKTGVKSIGNKNYTEYIITKKTEAMEKFILYNNDILKIKYRMNLLLGTNELITRLYTHDYYEDRQIFEDHITKVRREYGQLNNLIIKESEWENKKIIVGQPVEWIKTIEIYNPNEVKIKDIYTTNVFPDRLNVKVMESGNRNAKKINIENEEKTTIDFFVDADGKERLIYFISATTGPVVEAMRNIEILEIKNNSVKVELNITLKNFAGYDYKEIFFEFPAGNIIECNYNFSGADNEIKIHEIKAHETKILYILYEEIPPVLRMRLNKQEYNCNETINLSLLIIQGEKKGYVEIEINGPDKSPNTVYSDLIHLDKKGDKKNINIKLNPCQTGKYTIDSYYKSDFQSKLVAKEDFFIECKEIPELHWSIFAIAAGLLIILLLAKVYRKKTLEEEIDKLRI